jgi:hypothetical protein
MSCTRYDVVNSMVVTDRATRYRHQDLHWTLPAADNV